MSPRAASRSNRGHSIETRGHPPGRLGPAALRGLGPAPLARATGRRPSRGQSTTEFAVLAALLVPLMLAVPLLGKLLDLLQVTEQASRYVAFEGTLRHSGTGWTPDADLAEQARRRFFSDSRAPVKTGDTAGNFAAHRNPLWSDAWGRPFIERFEDGVLVRTTVSGVNAIAATAPFRSALGLSHDNLYTAEVTAQTAPLRGFAPLDTRGLRATRRTVILVDAWTARDPGDIRGRIEGSAVLYPIGAMKEIVDVIGQIPAHLFDPALEVGAFDWDVVPCDRLIGGCR